MSKITSVDHEQHTLTDFSVCDGPLDEFVHGIIPIQGLVELSSDRPPCLPVVESHGDMVVRVLHRLKYATTLLDIRRHWLLGEYLDCEMLSR